MESDGPPLIPLLVALQRCELDVLLFIKAKQASEVPNEQLQVVLGSFVQLASMPCTSRSWGSLNWVLVSSFT